MFEALRLECVGKPSAVRTKRHSDAILQSMQHAKATRLGNVCFKGGIQMQIIKTLCLSNFASVKDRYCGFWAVWGWPSPANRASLWYWQVVGKQVTTWRSWRCARRLSIQALNNNNRFACRACSAQVTGLLDHVATLLQQMSAPFCAQMLDDYVPQQNSCDSSRSACFPCICLHRSLNV